MDGMQNEAKVVIENTRGLTVSEIKFNKELRPIETSISGLVVYDLAVFGDSRGWFKENWQRQKMMAIGLADFGPVQNNCSYNNDRGVVRGIHAEPWDKFISLGAGKIFGFWVDVRQGSETFGRVFTTELDASRAIFVPRGVASGYQTLEDNTVYSYLVNDHWSADAKYANVSMFDESLGISYPIPLSESEISDRDKNHPKLADVTPLPPKKTLIIGSNGQLGRALHAIFPDAEGVDLDTVDMSDPKIATARRWRDYRLILNAAAYTAVDLAETEQGRRDAWLSNASALVNLVKIANGNNLTLVHVSSDYVFDGTTDNHTEDEGLAPLGVYAQSKAAGDLVVSTTPKHYIVRTSWVIGDGKNFVRTMKDLAAKGVKPSVVSDQVGRLTFASDLAAGIKHLLDTKAAYGTYNFSNDGDAASWAYIAKQVYKLSGKSTDDVAPVTTEKYNQDKGRIAPRPLQSTLDLAKIKSAGFTPREWKQALREYLQQ
jgi:dTDP-4-dehydrorhamnose 3,5-epimerase